MMKKNISNPFKKLYAFLTVPALALYLIACSEKEFVAQAPNKTKSTSNVYGIALEATKEPLWIIDGKEVSTFEDIKSEDIESISVLKDVLALDRYGEKGKNGVILVTMKKNATQKAEPDQQQIVQTVNRLQLTSNQSKPSQSLSIRSINGKEPLYFIDGKEVQNIENIKPEDIESISVLKDGAAKTIYGERGYNGVILITTKEASRKN